MQRHGSQHIRNSSSAPQLSVSSEWSSGFFLAPLAQLVELVICTDVVLGSIPRGSSQVKTTVSDIVGLDHPGQTSLKCIARVRSWVKKHVCSCWCCPQYLYKLLEYKLY